MAKLKSDDLKSFLEIPCDKLEEMNLKAAQRAEKPGSKSWNGNIPPGLKRKRTSKP
jgi:hypothetical protein